MSESFAAACAAILSVAALSAASRISASSSSMTSTEISLATRREIAGSKSRPVGGAGRGSLRSFPSFVVAGVVVVIAPFVMRSITPAPRSRADGGVGRASTRATSRLASRAVGDVMGGGAVPAPSSARVRGCKPPGRTKNATSIKASPRPGPVPPSPPPPNPPHAPLPPPPPPSPLPMRTARACSRRSSSARWKLSSLRTASSVDSISTATAAARAPRAAISSSAATTEPT